MRACAWPCVCMRRCAIHEICTQSAVMWGSQEHGGSVPRPRTFGCLHVRQVLEVLKRDTQSGAPAPEPNAYNILRQLSPN